LICHKAESERRSDVKDVTLKFISYRFGHLLLGAFVALPVVSSSVAGPSEWSDLLRQSAGPPLILSEFILDSDSHPTLNRQTQHLMDTGNGAPHGHRFYRIVPDI
jgi:hypothetical protein